MSTYIHGHHESVLRSHRWRTAENSAAHLLPHLRPGQRLLDVGSGPGTITADLARLVAPGRVTAVEPTESALDLTRRTVDTLPNVDCVQSDVHGLDFPDDSFDIVHAHQVLQHVADPVGALREMRRVCRPDGVVAVRDSDYAGFIWYPLVPELDDWLDLYRRVARLSGGEPDAGRRLYSWAQAAGFRHVVPSSSTWCYAEPEARAWWGALWADRALKSDMASLALAHGAATEGDLHRIADGWRTWAAAPDGWLSIVHGEVVARP